MENHVLILRLRQNIFALARHLGLTSAQLQELAHKADCAAPEEACTGDNVLEKATRRRRSLQQILLGVEQNEAAARAHPRMAETPAPYAHTKSATPAPRPVPEQDCVTRRMDRAASISRAASQTSKLESPSLDPLTSERRRSDPLPGQWQQRAVLPTFRMPRQTWEPSQASRIYLAPIMTRKQQTYIRSEASPAQGGTGSSLPASLHSAMTSSPPLSAPPSPPASIGEAVVTPVPETTLQLSRFDAYRLPAPRPTQRLYCGVGPSLAAFVTSPGSGR